MKIIKGFEDYTIDKSGVIINNKFNRILKANRKITGNNYISIGLYKDCKKGYTSLHRLLATAFIPNPENKPCVNHINSIRYDNRLENLEWVTHKENSQHALSSGLWLFPKMFESKRNIFNKKQAKQLLKRYLDGENCVKLGKEFGVGRRTMWYNINKAREMFGGNMDG